MAKPAQKESKAVIASSSAEKRLDGQIDRWRSGCCVVFDAQHSLLSAKGLRTADPGTWAAVLGFPFVSRNNPAVSWVGEWESGRAGEWTRRCIHKGRNSGCQSQSDGV